MADDLNIFNKKYNDLKNSNGGRVTPQRDYTIRDSNLTELSKIASKHDRPDYISGKKTFNAVVVYDYPKNSPPVAGTNLEGMLSSLGDINADNLLQVRAVVPDAHDLITPMPTDLSPSSVRASGEQQKYISLAPVFQSTGELNGALTVGSIIEVEYNDEEYSEGKIVSIVKSTSIFEAAIQSAKNAFDSAVGAISNLGSSGVETGDGQNSTDLSTPAGKCGGVGSYLLKDCVTKTLAATGQSVTLHPDFFDLLDQLMTRIKEETGVTITVTSSTRTIEKQISLRKSNCPEWQMLLSTMSEEQIMTISWSKLFSLIKDKNGKGCNNGQGTPTAPAYGNPSNHTLGLAVDLDTKMGSGGCPDKAKDQAGWQNCRNKSQTFIQMSKYASEFNIINYDKEPWHWSWNGR